MWVKNALLLNDSPFHIEGIMGEFESCQFAIGMQLQVCDILVSLGSWHLKLSKTQTNRYFLQCLVLENRRKVAMGLLWCRWTLQCFVSVPKVGTSL